MTSKDDRHEKGGELHRRAEEVVRRKAACAPENLEALSREEMLRMLHELQIHQIELEIENEELQRAQAELDAEGAKVCSVLPSDVSECQRTPQELISDLKETEAALREHKDLLRSIIDSTPSNVFAFDLQHRFTLLNDAMAQFYGVTKEELLGKTLHDVFPKDLADTLLENNSRIMATGVATTVEEVVVSKVANVPRTVMTSKFPLRNMQGAITGLGGVATDITDGKRAEEEKGRLEAQLQHAQKMESVGQLAGGVAHEFNNMLSVIIGYAQVAIMKLEAGEPSPPVITCLTEIRKAADRSADITRQLLAFARKQAIAPIAVELNETLVGMFRMIQQLIGEEIDLCWQPGANLWPVKVDPSQIDQILANLCLNARDAISGVGRIIIKTGNITLDERYCATHEGYLPGDYVRLAVSDNGCGMGEEVLGQIFEPFFTTKGVGEGTGLGLATVYGIVRQNNGCIEVESERGRGTTVTIHLPRYLVGGEEREKDGLTESLRGHETILLVEDEPSILEITTTLLELLGYTVLAAGAPSKAILLAEEAGGKIDLLMTDLIMPGMSGVELAEKLLSRYPHLKRLFMSGYTPKSLADRGVLAEGVHFIEKPFSISDLACKVREVLES